MLRYVVCLVVESVASMYVVVELYSRSCCCSSSIVCCYNCNVAIAVL